MAVLLCCEVASQVDSPPIQIFLKGPKRVTWLVGRVLNRLPSHDVQCPLLLLLLRLSLNLLKDLLVLMLLLLAILVAVTIVRLHCLFN